MACLEGSELTGRTLGIHRFQRLKEGSLMIRLLMSFTMVVISAAFAQTPFGTILGTAHDPTGAIVRGGLIIIRNTATGGMRHTVTGQSGSYEITALPVGVYDITCEAQGFK